MIVQGSSKKLASWMSDLPIASRCLPIINLAIPGSHDSMTYGIVRSATLAPDANYFFKNLFWVAPCVVRRWVKTQMLDITQQLNIGVRYFDLRFSLKRKSCHTSFYFVHVLFAETVRKPLCEIRAFLDEHPKEFVILDCQHFYEFQIQDFQRFFDEMRDIFGNRIYSRSHGSLKELTLDLAEWIGKQVLIIFRPNTFAPVEFWPSNAWATPWPNQIQVEKLQSILDSSLKQRTADCGYVSQCVLTPPARFIIPHFYSSLRTKCAIIVCRKLLSWINIQRPGSEKGSCNVFIADFVDLNHNQFCKMVISLNNKLSKTNLHFELKEID